MSEEIAREGGEKSCEKNLYIYFYIIYNIMCVCVCLTMSYKRISLSFGLSHLVPLATFRKIILKTGRGRLSLVGGS